MAEGIVKWFDAAKGFGFIRREGEDDLFIHLTQWRGPEGRFPQRGDRVTFTVGPGLKGKMEAKGVQLVAAGETEARAGPRPRLRRSVTPRTKKTAQGYRFLNPYNFVRYLEKPRPENRVLGDCPPPPHDRYLALTGTITCELEAVTPLFISDTHGVQSDPDHPEHKIYRFFQYDGQDAVPASSLRGAIRAVFEAVTNSCFAVFEGPRLSYRLQANRAATLVPARVEEGQNGQLQLNLLPGFAPVSPGQRPREPYAATVHLYNPIRGRRVKAPRVSLDGLKHGDECYALVEKKGIFTYVLRVSKRREDLPEPSTPSQHRLQGWLCINNQNVENKRKERFFFRAEENEVEPARLALPDDVQQAYRDLIADYHNRHQDAVAARHAAKQPLDRPVPGKRSGDPDQPALSRYMYAKDDLRLQPGTLVYAALSHTEPWRVEYIAPAAVPRVSYHHSVADLLSRHAHLEPCKEYDSLCPACRVFGWVYDPREAKGELPPTKTVAYAGRLHFSHAWLSEDHETMADVTMAILSSPKPTTTRFYLRPASGSVRDGLRDEEAGYDGDNVLRGRKVYRHHGKANPLEYRRATTAEFDGKDDQNRTVRGARKPGNKFTFTIDFTNLAPSELGALLWTLELADGDWQGCHRLGFAKPLGFGSAKPRITGLQVVDPSRRYSSLTADGGWTKELSNKDEWVRMFKAELESLYRQPFNELVSVRDLKALLGEPPDLPIHYPRVDREPSPEGKEFEWFMGNKRSGRDAGPRLALREAEEDNEGFPLLDKSGRIR
jgi:CRISPR-associated protein (TIGR03986 family)